MRVIALIAARNEERFIAGCIEHYARHGIDVYLIDNESTDRTVEYAEPYLGRGLLGIETVPHTGTFKWRRLLERKEQLADELEADWFIHADPDEVRLPPWPGMTLAQAIDRVGDEGYNAVNFIEFTFVPTLEQPDHDHPGFRETMLWYYPFRTTTSATKTDTWRKSRTRQPFLARVVRRVRRYKLRSFTRGRYSVDLAWSGGHMVDFPGKRIYPVSFPMRHYLFLSVPHAVEKYGGRIYDASELRVGWHGSRAALRPAYIELPSHHELRRFVSDDELDPTNPENQHAVLYRTSQGD